MLVRALAVLLCCLAVAAPPASGAEELSGRLEAGERLLNQGEFARALEVFDEVVALAGRGRDEASVGAGLLGQGRARWGGGDYSGAIDSYERALPIFRKHSNHASEALCLNGLGLAHYSLARYDEALGFYERALEVNRRAPSPRLEGLVLANMGLVHRFQGRYEDSLRLFEASLAIRRRMGDPSSIGQTLNHLGMVSRARGEYARALQYYEESLAQRREAGDRQGEAQTLNNMGNVRLDLGQRERAIEHYTDALAIAEAIGYTAQIGFSHMNIGIALASLGRAEPALARYDRALAVWRQMGRRGQLAWVLTAIGQLRSDALNDPEGARAPLGEALEVARAISEPEQEARALHALGGVEARAGNLARALLRYDEALPLAARIGYLDLEYRIRADRGGVLRDLGRVAEAVDELRAGVRIVSDLRANVRSDIGKIAFMDTRLAVYHDLAELLLATGRVEEALETAEAARARAFADLLAQREVIGKPAERESLSRVRRTLDEARTAPRRAGGAPAVRRGGTDPVDRSLVALREQNGELASLLTVDSPDALEMREIARRLGATIVAYLVTERQTIAWAIDRRGTIRTATSPAGRERLTGLVTAIRLEIDRLDANALRDPDRPSPALRELHRLVIEPVSRWLPASPDDPVVFIPHGPLALLPFPALIDEEGRPLAERHTLAFAPAISVYRYTPEKRRRALGASGPPLIVAAPTPPPGAGLEPLPGSRDEGDRVRAHLGAGRVRLLVEAAATKAAVTAAMADAPLIHFATHGLVSEDRPLTSSLVLAEGGGEDGYLRVDEIFGLDLAADLIVLSGCSTGLGRLSGDGIFGLARAFIYAGTPSILVTTWEVSDRATVFLMDRFYAELSAGRTKAAALRAAQLAGRERFGHPALWAGFILLGEPQ